MAIKAILFDKDGTLIDFEATWRAIAENMAMKAADSDRAEADRLLAVAGYDAENRCFKADSVFAAGTNAELIQLWYPEADAEERHALVASYDRFTAQEGANHAVALDGVKEALATLHENGIKLGVATNDSTLGAEKTLLALGIAQMFAAAYGYDAVANPKPAPDALHAFADMNGLRPSEVAMVGDNRHDLEMARAAGAGLAVGVLSGTGSRKTLGSLADVILGSVAELPAYMQENP
ncbi:HAD family hydrolase [Tianweitania populi]|uniref:phosphoglycolate phosphatase n=1 Tax=Tianweitania populi TaxID=1607949 RepID=A0A8J3DXG4_9HYPH|nr:HAD family hydrolase [Tianweitania populi]GHD16221.1 haloacid dehalogenase [Tianweitania populi]